MTYRNGLTVLCAGLLAVVLLAGCAAQPTPTNPEPPAKATFESEIKQLASKQVDNYKGKRLDSITKLQENSIKGPQSVDVATYRLKIAGEVTSPTALTYDEVLALPKYQKVITLNCVEGWSAELLWEGAKLTDVLAKAGYDPNAKIVIFRSADGYSTSLPLSYIRDNDILLAYKMNDVTLPKARGFPFQVVAEDKWGYKWAKWVTDIEVSNDENFRGYWESRGYQNDGDPKKTRKLRREGPR